MVNERRHSDPSKPVVFELMYQPNLGLATAVSRCALAFYRQYVSDTDVLSRLRIASQELLENAALYSLDGETSFRLEVACEGSDLVITIRITNRADSEDIARLKESFGGLEQAADAREYYDTLMCRVAKRERLSGLGLGRINAEPEMQLRYEVDQDQVSVVASTRCSKEVADE